MEFTSNDTKGGGFIIPDGAYLLAVSSDPEYAPTYVAPKDGKDGRMVLAFEVLDALHAEYIGRQIRFQSINLGAKSKWVVAQFLESVLLGHYMGETDKVTFNPENPADLAGLMGKTFTAWLHRREWEKQDGTKGEAMEATNAPESKGRLYLPAAEFPKLVQIQQTIEKYQAEDGPYTPSAASEALPF